MFHTLPRLLLCVLRIVCIASCALPPVSLNCNAASLSKFPTRNSTSVEQLKRNDPGYLQYLESKSLLGSSRELARIVSGSQIMWHAPATEPTPESLLQSSSSWLSIHPIPLLTRRGEPVFAHLANPVFWNIMRQLGMEGLYISPSSGTGALWRSTRHRVIDWDGMTQLAFTDTVGDDRDYGLLLVQANQNRVFLGLEMTQGATGLGADFFLGVRGNPEFQRLYRMREIPPQFWTDLPQSEDEWDCKELSAEQVSKLAAKKLILAAESQNPTSCRAPWGWAVTGTVLTGKKGVPKRFIYRYFSNPLRPIMDWEDPKAGARRILSACAIRRIGTQGAALLGMQTRALHGLNPDAKPHDVNQEPALSAAVSIGREVRRYGAWTWLEDELSLPQTHAFLHQGPDFALDTVSSPGAEHALLTGNAELARFMYDEARKTGIDQRRLVRRLPDERGISYALPHLCSLNNADAPLTPAQAREQAERSGGAWSGSTLYAGSAGLAALALHGNFASQAAKAAIRQGQTLLLFFKAMQPGLFMLPARDLLGALPLDGQQGRQPPPGNEPALAMHGAYNLLSIADDAPAGKGGLPRASVLYPPLDVQEMLPAENFLKSVKEILRIRKQTDIAGGRFITRLPTKNPGSIALLFALPGDHGAVLTVSNFSRSSSHESLNLNTPEAQPFTRGGARNIWGTAAAPSSINLGPWQGTAFLFGKMPDRTGRPPVNNTTLPSPDVAETGLKSPYTPGMQKLKRGEKSYIVQPGDQLRALAARHNVSPNAIMRRNNIPSPDLILEGRMLVIPIPDAAATREAEKNFPQLGESQQPLPSPDRTPDDGKISSHAKKADDVLLRQEEQQNEQEHVVRQGDRLDRLAAHYGISVRAIMERNNLSSPNLIVLEKTLIIPAKDMSPQQSRAAETPAAKPPKQESAPRTQEQEHIVQQGDRLNSLASRYGVSVKAIMERNNLSSPNLIVLGEKLVIPVPVQ